MARTRIRFKPSVKFTGLQPQVVFALMVAEEIFEANGEGELWVTSLNDSTHKLNSLHYTGRAVDIRTKTIPEPRKTAIFEDLKSRLAPGFQVLLESYGTPNEHLHLEFDPKG